MSLLWNPTRTLLIAILAAFLLATAAPAHAQADLVGTYLEVETTPPLGEAETWDGSEVSGSVNVALCSDEPGGANPAGGAFTIEASVSGPDWAEVAVSPESITLTPATGPEPEAPGCMDSGSFSISASADQVEYASTAELSISLSVSQGGGDEDVPLPGGAGTYAAPSAGSASMTINTTSSPGDDGNDSGNPDPADGGPGDTNDSPAPAAVAIILVVVAIVGLQRQR